MIKKILIVILLLFVILFPFFYPVQASTQPARTTKSTYVYQKPSTSSKRAKIGKNAKIYIIEVSGKFCKIYNSKKTAKGYILKKYVRITSANPTVTPTPTPEDEETSWKSRVKKLKWTRVNALYKVGKYAYIYDIYTNTQIKVKRVGGLKHADIEPATIQDTDTLLNIYKNFSWTTHPVILIYEDNYIAASINTMPHGKQSIKTNDFEGHFCLHVIDSKTHGTNKINKKHQECIEKAYRWAH